MPKCDISIEFDREDRTYFGGDTVGGTVRIRVNQDLTSSGIHLWHYWQTHGLGNVDCGEQHKQTLAESCPLQDGQALELPFSFTAKCQPVTYRGENVNIDHYVRVEVDVPWAFDPKCEEEYILRPGERPAYMTGRRDQMAEPPEGPTNNNASCVVKIIGGVIAVVVLAMLSTLLLVAVPVLLVGGGGYFLWKKMIASRVGNVEFKTPHVIVGPGESWPLEFRFTPRKSFAINSISLKLLAQEEATSGSGTNRTTHQHTIHEEVFTLQTQTVLVAGESFDKKFAIELPETVAYSFDESNNKIEWSVEARIDIPRFPDWQEKKVLQLVPLEFLEDLEADTTATDSIFDRAREPVEPDAATALSLDESPLQVEPRLDDSVIISPEPIGEPASVPAIVTFLTEIAQAAEFGSERKELVAEAASQTFDLSIDIDRITSTYTSNAGERYENGRTITGSIVGTDHIVQLLTANESRAQVDGLNRGDRWNARVSVFNWDTLYNRLVLREVP